jgi:hypothetical protein
MEDRMAEKTTTGAKGDTAAAGAKTTETPAAAAKTTETVAGAAGDGKTTETPAAAGTTPEGAAGDKGTEGAADGKGKKADTAAAETPAGPPDKYELTVPEGGRLDDADLKRFESMAREQGLTNDEAQAALDLEDAYLAQRTETLLSETKADKDYGGDKLAESQRLARAVIDRVRPAGHARRESFIRFLNKGGDGNHIEVVSFLADLGRMMGEDSRAAGGAGGGGSKKTAEEIMYPNTPKS